MTNTDPNKIVSKFARELKSLHQVLKVEDILQRAIAIQQIPAPTFEEQQRTAYKFCYSINNTRELKF